MITTKGRAEAHRHPSNKGKEKHERNELLYTL